MMNFAEALNELIAAVAYLEIAPDSRYSQAVVDETRADILTEIAALKESARTARRAGLERAAHIVERYAVTTSCTPGVCGHLQVSRPILAAIQQEIEALGQ